MGIHMFTPLYTNVIKRVLKAEEQTQHDSILGLDSTDKTRAGQFFNLAPNRRVAKLAFKLVKLGSPTGNVTFTIRSHSTGNILNSKIWGDASILPTDYPAVTWQEVAFDIPKLIDEVVYMLAEFSGGDAVNQVAVSFYEASDLKPNEYLWDNVVAAHPDDDCTYRYKYYEV